MERTQEDNWTHLFEGPVRVNVPMESGEGGRGGEVIGEKGQIPEEVLRVYNEFQTDLKELSAYCDEFNAKALSSDACFPHNFTLNQINPKYLETAVSV